MKQNNESATSQKGSIAILGIETSCDETSAAVVIDGKHVASNVIASQMDLHSQFGGVVPEVASRRHVEQITHVIDKALKQAGRTFADIQAIAVTQGPGLIGALLIGVSAAKALAFSKNIPLVAVHHIEGHIYANRLQTDFSFPCLNLVVSGGHTQLILMKEHGRYRILGETRDDACGEAYDKVARTLGLSYPGGPAIDKLAAEGSNTIPFPRAWLEQDSYDFSFSGLKSAVINHVHNSKQRGKEVVVADVAASFQESVVDVLVTKTMRAATEYGVRQLLVAGGVAANRALRKRLREAVGEQQIDVVIPPLELCTDNAAMIAAAGYIHYRQGRFAGMDLNGVAGLELSGADRVT